MPFFSEASGENFKGSTPLGIEITSNLYNCRIFSDKSGDTDIIIG